MASIKVCVTTDYEKFKLHPFNRDVKKIKKLLASMQKYGFRDANPLDVTSNGGGKLEVRDGHHRLHVARMLGLPVKYVVCNDSITMYELEGSKNKFLMDDYLTSFARQGREAYVTVLQFHQATGIGIGDCISMLGGQSAGHNNFADAFKAGTYKTGNTTHAYVVADIVLHCKRFGIKWAANCLFVQAISRIVQAEGFDCATLKHKIEAFPYLLEKQPNLVAYQNMIERVYNRQSRKMVPLAFNADKAAKARNAIKS